MTVYRDDARAREMLIESLERENRELVTENKTLRDENVRLKIIGRELATAPPVVIAPSQEARRLTDLALLDKLHDALYQTRHQFRLVAMMVFGVWLAYVAQLLFR